MMPPVSPADFDFYSVTIDVDWAPDFWIDEMAAVLEAGRVPCTWFITHRSPAIDRILANPLFECGIHPNFFEHSSHGHTEDEIIEHCLKMVPGARSVRTHALYQSSRLLYKLYEQYGFISDSSLFMPHSNALVPHHLTFSQSGKHLIRIPYFWEDDVECLAQESGWDIRADVFHPEGLKVFNFHPVYFGLNCRTLDNYNALKHSIRGQKSLDEVSELDVQDFIHTGPGVKTCFLDLISLLSGGKKEVRTQSSIADHYRAIRNLG
jgi:hypothetical protein